MRRIAIIGAGMAGLTAAHYLKPQAAVTLFDKSRGVSGRISTRYADPYQFDHGAQYFTARSKAFQAFLAPHIASGLIVDWQPKIVTLSPHKKPYKRDWFEPHYVAVPRMNALCKTIAADHDVHVAIRIASLTKEGEMWVLDDEEGNRYGPYDMVISAIPAPQAAALLPDDFAHKNVLHRVTMSANITLMLGYDTAPSLPFQAALVKDSPLGWIAVNSAKPGRDQSCSLVVQTTPDWADAHVDMPRDAMQTHMLSALKAVLPDVPDADDVALHRWLYAGVHAPAGQDYLYDEAQQLAAIGDWYIKGRVEAAFTSGHMLAEHLS